MSHSSTKRRRVAHEEEHENHERWLVTYADMLTLLMVLFIVMFAISQVDQKKFNELRTGMAAGFGMASTILDGTQGVVSDQTISPTPINIGGFGGPEAASATDKNERAAASAQSAAVAAEVGRLEGARKKIAAALQALGLQGSVQYHYDSRGLVVSILTDKVVFPPDLATLQPQGAAVLRAIAPALASLPNALDVEGNTNQVGHPKYYPTEWELSVARAVTVVRFLIDSCGISAHRLSATGNADQKPLLPPSNPKAAELNKRVDIVIETTLSTADSSLLAAAAPSS